jgi:hypothetical protein
MSLTYSINLNTITETTRQESIYTVLNNLPNNTAKLISPRDVRNAFLTSWSNSIFKITTPDTFSSYPYIGIDTNNPTDKDFKSKILLGKRSFGALDTMSPTLLSSDTDIFFYNTKDDSSTQSSTKLTILAGTYSSYYPSAPYIESYYTGSEIDLNINNPNGSINMSSLTGRISVNNVNFPTISENASDISDGKVLRYVGVYPSGKFEWVFPSVTTTTIGSTGSVTNVFGSPVLLNGYPLEFVETELVPKTIGGVNQGDNFPSNSFNGQDWPVTEVIRKLLYPYVPPELNISVSNLTEGGIIYAEVGVVSNIEISYDITRFSNDISLYNVDDVTTPILIDSGNYSGLPGTGISNSISNSTNLSNTGDVDFVLSVSDNTSMGLSYSATASITFVDPIYYGFTSSDITTPSEFNTFIDNNSSKLLKPYGTQSYYEADYDGSGFLYFAYPQNFGPGDNLNEIKDPNGYIIHDENSISLSSFTHSIVNRPTTLPYSINYKLWRTKLPTTWDGPSTFKFKF